MQKKNEIKKSHTIYYVLGSLACVIGVLFSWVSVIYALDQNPIVKIFSGRLPQIEDAEAKEKTAKKNEAPDVLPRRLDGRLMNSSDANHFPVAVMIENLVTIRPQSGLSQASLVYESLVEGGITRFMAIFDVYAENIGQIGPVRSARPYYLEWLSEYDALYAHAGGSPEALQSISAFGLHDLNQIRGAAQYFWRDHGISAPHNLFTSTELLQRALRDQGLADKEPTFESWDFKAAKKDKTKIENKEQIITINYSTGKAYKVDWKYDVATAEYLRFSADVAHTDRNTDQQIRAKSVIIVIIPPIVSIGEKGRLTLDVSGEGKVLVAREGEIIEGIWKKADRTTRMKFMDAQEKEIELRPGATWIQIVPSDREVIYQ